MKATLVVAPSSGDANIGLVLGQRGFDILIKEGNLTTLAALFECLSGAYEINEICTKSGLSRELVAATVDKLGRAGLVYDYADAPAAAAIDRSRLIALFESFAVALRFDISRHHVFEALELHERLFLAAATEHFHVIRDAGTHTALALQHAPAELVPIIRQYQESEIDHYRIIGPRLRAALGGEFGLEELAPLASTEGLILKTHHVAHSDTLAYMAACSFAESRSAVSDLAFSAGETRWADETLALLHVLREHAAIDHGAAHSRLFADGVMAFCGEISERRAARILTTVHECKHYFDNLNFELLRVYGAHGAPLPRLEPRLADYVEPQ
jgi:hypothetical protein